MIVEFSVKNFRSIKDLQTISFSASTLKSSPSNKFIDENNIIEQKGTKLFRTIGLYGANASGKSNVLKALDAFIKVITSQPSSLSNLKDLCQPFLYQKESEETESLFQLVVIVNNIKYRYGLTVKKNTLEALSSPDKSTEIVTNEWLYSDRSGKLNLLFLREGTHLSKNYLQNKSKIPNSLPFKHTLFLSHAAAFDKDSDCFYITNYFRKFAVSNFEVNHDKFRWMSIFAMENKDFRAKFIKLLKDFNLDYDNVFLEEDSKIDSIKEVFPQEKIFFEKSYISENEINSIELNLKHNESAGTQKMFDLAGLILRAFSMSEPAFIIIDEIDSNFHPSLLIQLINLFNNPVYNKSNSQLIFTSHDTNLMSPDIMRRDQFFFTEKKQDNSSRVFSLAELKGIRNDADFAKGYLSGFYGALPLLHDYSSKNNYENSLTDEQYN